MLNSELWKNYSQMFFFAICFQLLNDLISFFSNHLFFLGGLICLFFVLKVTLQSLSLQNIIRVEFNCSLMGLKKSPLIIFPIFDYPTIILISSQCLVDFLPCWGSPNTRWTIPSITINLFRKGAQPLKFSVVPIPISRNFWYQQDVPISRESTFFFQI